MKMGPFMCVRFTGFAIPFMFPITYFAWDIGRFTNSLVNSASLCVKVLKY